MMKNILFLIWLLLILNRSYGQIITSSNSISSTYLSIVDAAVDVKQEDGKLKDTEAVIAKNYGDVPETHNHFFTGLYADLMAKQVDMGIGGEFEIGHLQNQDCLKFVGSYRLGGQLDGEYSDIFKNGNLTGGQKHLVNAGVKLVSRGRSKIAKSEEVRIRELTGYVHHTVKHRNFFRIDSIGHFEKEEIDNKLHRYGFGLSFYHNDIAGLRALLDFNYAFNTWDNFKSLEKVKNIEFAENGSHINQKESTRYLGDYNSEVNFHQLSLNGYFISNKNTAQFGVLFNPELFFGAEIEKSWIDLNTTIYLFSRKSRGKDFNPFAPSLGVTISYKDLFHSGIVDDETTSRFSIGITSAFYFTGQEIRKVVKKKKIQDDGLEMVELRYKWNPGLLEPGKKLREEFLIPEGYYPLFIELPNSTHDKLVFSTSIHSSRVKVPIKLKHTDEKETVEVWLENRSIQEYNHDQVSIVIQCIKAK